jgi:starch synthase
MRYGCLPVVTAVGGLRDTVIDGETGFVARVPTATRLASAAKRAMRLLPDKVQWTTMQRAAMARDFSWGAAARQYYDLYQRLVSQATPDPDLVS